MINDILEIIQLSGVVRAKNPEITAEQLVSAMLNNKQNKDIAKELGISDSTFKRLASRVIPDKGKSRMPWRNYLTRLLGFKLCDFHGNYEISKAECPVCKSDYQKIYYDDNKVRIINRTTQYAKDNPGKINAICAKRRANKLNATPAWSEILEIEDVYTHCPEGYHVDHIIPLTNDLVCGLHVLENLQYLTAKDNIRKSNKFEI